MKLNIAVLPGDGIGPEIAAQGVEVMSAVCKKFGHEVRYEYALWGRCYRQGGRSFPGRNI